MFYIGGFHSGYETFTIDLTDNQFRMDTEHSLFHKPSNFYIEPDYPMSKEEFLDKLRQLNIGEWRRGYTTKRFGYEVLDGTQWDLEIQFSNKNKPFKVYGDNAYPYNFDDFQKLFGIDDDEFECE